MVLPESLTTLTRFLANHSEKLAVIRFVMRYCRVSVLVIASVKKHQVRYWMSLLRFLQPKSPLGFRLLWLSPAD